MVSNLDYLIIIQQSVNDAVMLKYPVRCMFGDSARGEAERHDSDSPAGPLCGHGYMDSPDRLNWGVAWI